MSASTVEINVAVDTSPAVRDYAEKYGLKVHRAAEFFPLLQGQEFADLCRSIIDIGLVHPIITLDGVLLDGRNRLRACLEEEVEPRFEEYTGDRDPTAVLWWIHSVNVSRRHLPDDQRVGIVTQFVDFEDALTETRRRQGEGGKAGGLIGGRGNKKVRSNSTGPFPEKKETSKLRKRVAGEAKVSEAKARQALMVKRKDPELLAKVANGSLKLREAEKVAKGQQPKAKLKLETAFDLDKAVTAFKAGLRKRIAACPDEYRLHFKQFVLEEAKRICAVR